MPALLEWTPTVGDMRTSFKKVSSGHCNGVAMRICTILVNPKGFAATTACQLITLNKCPGVRPIGIGETVCIIFKAILYFIGQDIQEAAGSSICTAQESGSEAAVLAMHKILQEEDTEAVVEVVATNAFNCLNSLLFRIFELCVHHLPLC